MRVKPALACRLLLLPMFALSLAACSGGGTASLPPAAMQTPSGAANGSGPAPASSGQVRVTATFAKGSLPQFAATSRKGVASTRRALSTSFKSLVFTGTIYPGYAGTATQTVSSTLNATSLPPSVGLAFDGVQVGNNEWVIITVAAYTGQNATGSSTPLGQLGGLFNVGSNASVTVDNGSTERLQLALAGMMDGLISTYDLSNQTSLDSDLGNFIGQSGDATDPNTGLFSSTTLSLLLDDLVSSYHRQITITGSIANGSTAYVTWDYTNASELNFANAVGTTVASLTPFDISLIQFPTVYGNPNADLLGTVAAGIGPHVPSAPAAPVQHAIISDGFDAPNGAATLANVYGGALRTAVSTGRAGDIARTFEGTGGFASVPGRARNSATAVPVSVGVTTFTINDNDTEGYYAVLEFPTILPQFAPVLAPVDDAYHLICHSPVCRGTQSLFATAGRASSTTNYVTYLADQFNPWALPSTSLQFCLVITAECSPISANETVTTHTPWFADTRGGAWPLVVPSSGAGATTTVTSANPDTIAYSASPAPASGYASFNLSQYGMTPTAYFYGGQVVDITTSAPDGSTFYFDLGCGGSTYQFTSSVENGLAAMTIDSLSGLVTCQSVTLGYTLNSSSTSGSFTVGPFLPPGT